MSVSLGRFFPPLLLLLLLPLGRYLWWQFEISVYETATHTWQRKKKRVKHREEKKKKVCTEQKTLIKKRPIDFQYTQCCAGLPVQSLVYMIKYYFPFFFVCVHFLLLGYLLSWTWKELEHVQCIADNIKLWKSLYSLR